VKKWICIEPSAVDPRYLPLLPISKCKACSQQQKQYDAYYYAAAHLRIKHFKPKMGNNRDAAQRGGKGGGDWPAMSELKKWMKEVHVPRSQLIEDANDDEEEEESEELVTNTAQSPSTRNVAERSL
jgi:hypothetical protein